MRSMSGLFSHTGHLLSSTTLRDCLEALSGKVILSSQACHIWGYTHGAVKEGGDTHLAGQIGRINPGDHWGVRCCSQIALIAMPIFWINQCPVLRQLFDNSETFNHLCCIFA